MKDRKIAAIGKQFLNRFKQRARYVHPHRGLGEGQEDCCHR